jgi:hypothetical protein
LNRTSPSAPAATARGDQSQVDRIHLVGRAARVGRQVVEVEFERIRAGRLELTRISDPAARRAGVEAGDDRHIDGRLDPLERRHVSIRRTDDPVDRGEVVERLGELLGALIEGEVELELLAQDLLLEQRRQDDRSDAGPFETAGHPGIAVVRRRGGDDR